MDGDKAVDKGTCIQGETGMNTVRSSERIFAFHSSMAPNHFCNRTKNSASQELFLPTP